MARSRRRPAHHCRNFARFGEADFRDGERKVIARLLDEPAMCWRPAAALSCDPATRARNGAAARVACGCKRRLDLLVRRVKKRDIRPLLQQGDLREILERLLAVRDPLYAEADITSTAPTKRMDTRVDQHPRGAGRRAE